jgi:hypothetical protein
MREEPDMELSPGTLQNIIRRTTGRLHPIVGQIKEALAAGDIVHGDESAFYIGGSVISSMTLPPIA